jgi:hypothetical protein
VKKFQKPIKFPVGALAEKADVAMIFVAARDRVSDTT